MHPLALPICLTLFVLFVFYVVLFRRRKSDELPADLLPYFAGCDTLEEMITKLEDECCKTPTDDHFSAEDLNALLVAAGGRAIAVDRAGPHEQGTSISFAALYLAAINARGK